MSNFFDSFNTFALETWSLDGVVSRIKGPAPQASIKRTISPFARRVAIALMATSIGVTVVLPVPASARSSMQWCGSDPMVLTSAVDDNIVPLNYWPGAIAQLLSNKLVDEEDFVEIDSPF